MIGANEPEGDHFLKYGDVLDALEREEVPIILNTMPGRAVTFTTWVPNEDDLAFYSPVAAESGAAAIAVTLEIGESAELEEVWRGSR